MYFLSFYRSTSSGLLFRRVNSKMERVFTFASITINAVSVLEKWRPSFHAYPNTRTIPTLAEFRKLSTSLLSIRSRTNRNALYSSQLPSSR